MTVCKFTEFLTCKFDITEMYINYQVTLTETQDFLIASFFSFLGYNTQARILLLGGSRGLAMEVVQAISVSK